MKKNYFPRVKGLVLVACAIAMNHLLYADAVLPPMPQPPSPVELPAVQVLATDPTALVGTSSAAFTFIRTGPATNDLIVNFELSGTASNGVDYVKIAKSHLIPAGYLADDLVIQPMFDLVKRGNKTVILTLRTNANYGLDSHPKATVTLVDDTYNNFAPTVSLKSPTNNSVFTSPVNITLEAQAADPDDAIARVSFYANDTYLGKATNAPFTWVWSNAPPGHYTLFARAVDNLNASTLSAPVYISVTNAPPTITLLSPADKAVFTLPANVEIRAAAADSDDAIAKVQFYGDGHLLGTKTTIPYSFTWTNVPPGNHLVLVRATDAVGLTASASAHITVSNAPPVVRITNPATANSNFKAPATITLQAEASDSDDAIRSVAFYANGHLVGTATASPYSVTWRNVAAGFYSVKAIATDEHGLKATSTTVHISVSK